MQQDQGMLQDMQKLLEEMKDSLKAVKEQVSDCMQSQMAHFQKRELYQLEKNQLQEQVSKLIQRSFDTPVSTKI